MRGGTGVALAGLAAVCAHLSGDVAQASSTTRSASELYFRAPKGLKDSDGIEHRSALFGSANFGLYNHMIGTVVSMEEKVASVSSMCPPLSASFERPPGDVVLLVDGWPRCSFVTETLTAQSQYALQGLFVMENVCLTANMDKSEKFKAHCQAQGPAITELNYMAGVESSVRIPAMIISRWDGVRLQECLKITEGKLTREESITDVDCAHGDESPLVEMRWNIAQAETVEYEVWMSSLLNEDIFVRDFWWQTVVPSLGDRVDFVPRFFVWNGNELHCKYDGATKPEYDHCGDACHNHGRYCHFDPDGKNRGLITGAHVSQENLRQLCLWQVLGGTKGDWQSKQKWWQYISYFANNCTKDYQEQCSKDMHKQLGLDFTATMKCVVDAGGYTDGDGENSIMETQLRDRAALLIKKIPTVLVNGKYIDFDSSLKNVVRALCTGFVPGKAPEVCPCVESNDYDLFSDEELLAACFDLTFETGVGFGTLFVVIFFVVVSLVAAFVIFRSRDKRRLRSEFHEDVHNIMGEYTRMDTNGEASNAPSVSGAGSFLGESIQPSGTVELADVGAGAAPDDDDDGPPPARRSGGYQHVVEMS